jgi:hypothetical protein
MPSGKSKGKGSTKSTTPEKKNTADSAVTQMLQDHGFDIVNGKFKNTDGLTTETQMPIVEKILENKIIMCRILSLQPQQRHV